MLTKNNKIKCDICGKFIGYKEQSYSWTYYGGCTDMDLPTPNHAHVKCYEDQTHEEKALTIITSWIKPYKSQYSLHTLGPWYPVNYAGYILIQSGPMYSDINILDEKVCEKAIANGNLAAAAPDLLEACQKALIHLEVAEIEKGLQVDLKQIIKKATGND